MVHTVHGNAFGPNFGLLKNCIYIRAEKWAARYCHKIYAVARAMIDQCVQAGIAPAEKYQVVYSGMDLRAFTDAKPETALRRQLGIPEGAPVIGTIARLFPLKGHDVLIRAAAKVLAAIPEARFLLVGDGILREQLEETTRQMGIRDHFIFAGLIDPEEVCRYTALMTVVAHLSLREGLPRAAVQGLAACKPVVAYPLDGTPEVVLDGETGFLCPVENADAVAEKIIWLLQHPEEREQMGLTGQQMVLQKFDWHRMADILELDYLQHLR